MAPSRSSLHGSQELWAALCNPPTPEAQAAAFENLLHLRSGFWGNCSLLEFALGMAKGLAHAIFNGEPDRVDWEAEALDAVLALTEAAPRIEQGMEKWLYARLRNRTYDAKRKHDRGEVLCAAPEDLERLAVQEVAHADDASPADSWADGVLSVHAQHDRERLREALAQLPKRSRLVIELTLLQNLSRKSIAKATGMSPDAVRQNYHRGLKRLLALMSTRPTETPEVPEHGQSETTLS
jgi:RNA polymerase sigma factor (sigma-70 family)